ncbi:MAG: arylsulfatase [Proteobacteria bacterium]|nr:arylsulfatase [Pseudomonadota bacterium]HQR04558.1 arylsulfatase [Rhodocyclaceae bacterium]
MLKLKIRSIFLVLAAMGTTALAQTAATPDTVLPHPDPVFHGKIGRTVADSRADYPKSVKAPKGAPNILLVMTDDVGFSASSAFGGEIPTPNLDHLAHDGLRYNRFHTTAMCSPTRAALLTGRNHHEVGTATVTDLASGYPGYNGIIPHNATPIARILRDNGYSTAMFGKHHNLIRTENSQSGPFNQWPSGLGFDYFYGFIGGDTNQIHPKLYRNTQPADPVPSPGYFLDRDLADDAIRWIHNQKAAAQDKPFFVYYAPGTAHSPHQAPREWIDRFKGKFDQGWDKVREETFLRQKAMGVIPADAQLTPRPAGIPAWDSLSADRKKVYARMMEVFAGMLAFQDNQFGRIVDELRRMGQLDNTLIVFIEGDNGASGEGTEQGTLNEIATVGNDFTDNFDYMLKHIDDQGTDRTYQIYPIGWAWAMDTPFQWVKQIASHLGGTRNGLVISWPQHIKAHGEVRSQFHHVIDITPTLLDLVGLPQPTEVDGVPQAHMEGVSMAYTFDDAKAADRRTKQYFELLGNRALYQDGWLVNTTPRRMPWMKSPRGKKSDDDYEWELYDLDHDYSQSRNLAKEMPDKLKAMEDAWWQEAARNQVLPVDDDVQSRDRMAAMITMRMGERSEYTYWARDTSVAVDAAPMMGSRSFSVLARVTVPKKGGEGVLMAVGSRMGGWAFYLKDGKPVALHAFSHEPQDQFRIAGKTRVPSGKALIRYDFDYAGGGLQKGGILHISVNGKEVASGPVGRTIIVPAGLGETLDIGRDTGLTVSTEYSGNGAFNGDIERVDIKVAPLMQAARLSATP